MEFPRLVGVVSNTTEYERRYCTPSTVASIAFLRTLDDATILDVAYAEPSGDRYCDVFEDVYYALSPKQSMNPHWLIGKAAEIAYVRQLIDEEELNTLTR